MKPLQEYLPHLPIAFIKALEEFGAIQSFDTSTEILREGQYVKMIPLVLEGVIKVYTRSNDKELLLYYIEHGQSCIMSFNAGFKNSTSKVFAVAEEHALLALMPVEKVNEWIKTFPSLATLFFNLYDQRYESLLDTINQLLYNKLDRRLYDYLLEKSRQKRTDLLQVKHREIAAELGTAREVITRVMKKLEYEGKIKQLATGIKIL